MYICWVNTDIRWQQRFSNFRKGLKKLEEAITLPRQEGASQSFPKMLAAPNAFELFKEGVIHRFEYTHELAWNVIRDYAAYQGNNTIRGSRDATKEGFKMK